MNDPIKEIIDECIVQDPYGLILITFRSVPVGKTDNRSAARGSKPCVRL